MTTHEPRLDLKWVMYSENNEIKCLMLSQSWVSVKKLDCSLILIKL